MAIKKSAKVSGKAVSSEAPKKSVPSKASQELSADELLAANLTALTNVAGSLSDTLDMLVQKVESMAYHIIATEEVLAEVVAANGLDLARVNARIRAKIADGTDNLGDSTRAVDIAAGIASPLSKCCR